MVWTAKMNCALRSRKRTESASMTRTRLKTDRIGCRNVTTPMPPSTAIAAATKKNRDCQLLRFLGVEAGLYLRRQRLQQLLLGVDEFLPTGVRELVLRPEHDRPHGAGLLAVAAEDAAPHVDLAGLRVALPPRDAGLVGVLCCDDQDAADRASRRAQLAPDAALESIVIAPQVMAPAITLRARRLLLRVHRGDDRPERFGQRGLQSRQQRGDITDHAGLSPSPLQGRGLG